jgi:hypothetical protein
MTQGTKRSGYLPNTSLLRHLLVHSRRVELPWMAVGITIASIALLIALNLAIHKIEVFNTVEDDGYFQRASALLHGAPYDDPYHPPLYIVLTAGLSLLFKENTFLAGSLISALSAGAVIGLTYPLARYFLSSRFALLAQLLVALDTLVIDNGIFVSTDALFAALSLAIVLVILLQYYHRSWNEPKLLALLGVLFGLAYITRYTSVFLFPVILLSIWQNSDSMSVRWRRIGVVVVTSVLVACPWLVYNTIHNGSPFANENWRNFALALYGNGDYTLSFLEKTHYHGYLDIIREHPADVVRLWMSNLLIIIIAIPYLHTSSLLLAPFLPFGMIQLVKHNRSGIPLIIYVAGCVAPVILTFYYNNSRLLLPATPVLIVIAVIGVQFMLDKLSRLTFSRRALLNTTIIAFILVILAQPIGGIPAHINAIIEAQPIEEVATLNHLLEERVLLGATPIKVVTTYLFIADFVSHPEQVRSFWISYNDPAFMERLLDTVTTQQADYVLLSDKTTFGKLQQLLQKQALPACWHLERELAITVGAVHLYKNECSPQIMSR